MLSKPYASLSFGRNALGVDVEREQVADRVAVLGAVQAMQRLAAGVRVRGGGSVELLLEVGDELGRRLRVRAAARRPAASCGRAAS